jgi:hypothetical protein
LKLPPTELNSTFASALAGSFSRTSPETVLTEVGMTLRGAKATSPSTALTDNRRSEPFTSTRPLTVEISCSLLDDFDLEFVPRALRGFPNHLEYRAIPVYRIHTDRAIYIGDVHPT